MVWGFFKKLVIADNVGADRQQGLHAGRAGLRDLVGRRLRVRGPDLRGLLGLQRHRPRHGALLGFDLMKNFDHPYLARTREFWRRWHISLSTWFRDYVYIPLGGSRGRRTLAQSAPHLPALRLLARRELEFPAVGRLSRPVARRRLPTPARPRSPGLRCAASRRCGRSSCSCSSTSAG